MIKKFFEKLYFWFRPRLEKQLFEVMREVSGEHNFGLDTRMYEYNPDVPYSKERLYKPAVDAFFFRVLNKVWSVSETVKLMDCVRDRTGWHKIISSNTTVGDYVHALAKVLKKEKGLQLKIHENWSQLWLESQVRGKKVFNCLNARYNLATYTFYLDNCAGYADDELHIMREKICRELEIEPQKLPSGLNEIASVLAFYVAKSL